MPPQILIPACTESVDAITRRSGRLIEVQYAVVHEFGYPFAAGSSVGAQLIIPRNPLRIRAVIYAPTPNSGTIYWGGPRMTPAQGDRLTGPNAFEMEPGTGWTIDDTIEAIYMFCKLGVGDQAVRWFEAVDDPRIPLLIAR